MRELDDETAEEYATWFRCLADPTRIKILRFVATAQDPVTVGEIVDAVGKRQSTVSNHLRLLSDTRFVFCEADGVRTLVRINESCMTALPEVAAMIMATDTLASAETAS
jgi:DNA-binding transcriptional ArsR family regulator